jgi:hypothetical protein
LVDFSFPVRQPAYCAALRQRFGDEAIRMTVTHAKFISLRNSTWNVVIRTSMNLNENRRMENIEVSDDAALAEFLESVCDRIFAAESSGRCFQNAPGENLRHFDKSFGVDRKPAAAGSDDASFFGDGAFDNDLRRVGQTWD